MKITNLNNRDLKRGIEIELNERPTKRARISGSDEGLADSAPSPSSDDSASTPEGYHLLSVRMGINWQNSGSQFNPSTQLSDLEEDFLFENGEDFFTLSSDQQKSEDESPSAICRTPLFDAQSPSWEIVSKTPSLNELGTPPRTRCCTPPPQNARVIPFSPKTKRSFRSSDEVPCLHAQNAIHINACLRSKPFHPFSIQIGQATVMVSQCLRELSVDSEKGAFSDVFLVNIESTDLPEVTQCVLKIPNIRYRENTKNIAIQAMLKSELYQYSVMKREFDCIARHYDFELLEQQGLYEQKHVNYGCHLVEYAPDAYPVGAQEANLAEPETLKFKTDVQLQRIFQQAYEKNIPLDLSFNNTRLLNGTIKCIDPWDPLVAPLDFEGEPFSFEKLIPTFAPAGSQRATFLDPSKTRNSH